MVLADLTTLLYDPCLDSESDLLSGNSILVSPMSYSHEQLLAFYHAAEGGSFSAAARRLGKAQSTISFLIDSLETDIGTRLFDRSKRSPTLTESGQSLLREVGNVLRAYSALEFRCRHLMVATESVLTLAVDDGAIDQDVLNQVLRNFADQFPLTNLVLLDTGHNGPFELVQLGKADLGIVFSVDSYPENLSFRGVDRREFVSAAAPCHPLAKLTSISIQDLMLHRHLRITSVAAGARAMDAEVSRTVWYTDSYERLVRLVCDGFGWADLPLERVENLIRQGSLVRLRTAHQLLPYTGPVDLIWSNAHEEGPALSWMIRELTDCQGDQEVRNQG